MDKVLIKDIAEVVNGSTPSTKENSYWDGNIPWITPKDLSAISGRYISMEKEISPRKDIKVVPLRLFLKILFFDLQSSNWIFGDCQE